MTVRFYLFFIGFIGISLGSLIPISIWSQSFKDPSLEVSTSTVTSPPASSPSGSGSDPESDRSLSQKIEKARSEGKWDILIELLNPRVQILDRSQLEILAEAYSKQGFHPQAVRVYQILVSQFSKDDSLKLALAEAQISSGEDKVAIQTLKDIIRANPKFEQAYVRLAEVIQKRQPRNLFEIRSTYEDLVSAVGPKPDYLVRLCDLTTREGQHVLASRYCQRALTAKPEEVASYINLMMVQFQTGREAAAHENLLRTKKRFPESFQLWRYAGQVYSGDKNYLMAYQAYQKASELDESNAEIRLELAKVALQLNLYDESYRHFARACKSDRSIRFEVRKAFSFLRQTRVSEWAEKFEQLAQQCGQSAGAQGELRTD
jgi:tetratricopeptide (TPR) repeat protein